MSLQIARFENRFSIRKPAPARQNYLQSLPVPEHDVFARITDEEYSDFYDTVCDAAKIAREAFDCEELYDSVCKWRELFGNEFPPAPKPSKSNSSTGFTTRTEKSAAIPEGRFA